MDPALWLSERILRRRALMNQLDSCWGVSPVLRSSSVFSLALGYGWDKLSCSQCMRTEVAFLGRLDRLRLALRADEPDDADDTDDTDDECALAAGAGSAGICCGSLLFSELCATAASASSGEKRNSVCGSGSGVCCGICWGSGGVWQYLRRSEAYILAWKEEKRQETVLQFQRFSVYWCGTHIRR